MDSALIDFLKKDYPSHFGLEWKEETMQIRRERRPKGKFEIRDGRPQIVQYSGHGVSVINNNSEVDVEIVDFEHYINIFQGNNAGAGLKCDFIINPIAGYDFIIYRAHEPLIHGFVFEQRIYDNEYRIC